MSYFEDASLVLIPSAQKLSKIYSVKPTDGTGDLTFTRSNDTATRVGPDGLIEKVRTNLLLQSNSFDTTWTNTNSTETGGQSGYDGSSDAWLLDKNATQGRVTQSISQSGIQTLSVYAKKGTSEFLRMFVNGPNSSIYFNLNDGSVQSSASIVSGKSTDVGGGWYRCEVAFDGTTTAVNIYPAESGSTAGTSGNVYIQDAQLETGDIATPYIGPTLAAAVSVGPVANVPRLDYLGSSCPRLILEGQRTNVITFSEQMDNAAWIKTNATVTANQTTSPSGYVDADKLIPSSGLVGLLQQNHNITATQANTVSIFAKAGELDIITVNSRDNASSSNAAEISFNLSTGVISTAASATGAYSAASGTITNYGNGWYRLTLTFTSSASVTNRVRAFTGDSGDGTKGLFVWGGQFETNASYPSSYVNTLGAAVTRGQDACSKTGISSLINSVEGVLYAEVAALANDGTSRQLSLSDGSSANNKIAIIFTSTTNQIQAFIRAAGSISFNSTFTLTNATSLNKIAIKWKVNDFALWVNGTEAATDISGGAPIGLSKLSFDDADGTSILFSKVQNLIIFPSAISDAQLAELTTI
jgi:hypothetical protein